MKKITLIFTLSILLSNLSIAQNKKRAITHSNHKQSHYTDDILYKRVEILKTIPNVMQKLDQAGVDLACGVYHNGNTMQIELSDYELGRIAENGVTYKVLIDDMTKFYSERAAKDMPAAQTQLVRDKQMSLVNRSSSVKNVVIGNVGQHNDCSEINWTTPQNFILPSTFGGCLTYNGVLAELDKMRLLYPNLISAKVNASPSSMLTFQNRVVYFVKISDNPDNDESEPQALYTGMTHAREVSSMMNQIYFMWYLLENYSTDPFIKNLVDNSELYFIPVVNPDGLVYNQTTAPDGGGMQRKNRKLTGGGCSGTLEGVDINRNFGYYYGNVPGSSATLCNDTYRGTARFSENETQIIRDFVLAKNIKTALNHHAFSNLLPHPINGSAGTVVTGREDEFAKFCHDMTQYNRYVYGPAPGILYTASGDASDWMCGGANDGTGNTGSGKNILAVSPENGAPTGEGGFWPTPTQIPIIARRALRMNLITAYYAGKYAKLHDLTQSNITTLTTNLRFGVERLGQTAANYTLTITPVSSNIVSITSPSVQTGMTILEQRNVTASIVLANTILPNQKIEYKVSLSNGDYTLFEANYVKIYNPTVLFNNADSDVLTKWTASPANSWVTTTSTINGTTSISESATNASYSAANSTKSIRTTNTINLSGAQKILVQFYGKWDLERNFDLVQIQGSVDGTNWVNLCGNYTKPTSNSSTNPHDTKSANSNVQNVNSNGGVLYDGDTFDKWVMEEIVIDASNNATLVGATAASFRFILRTDDSNRTDGYNTTFDGFYFDEFRVIKQVSEPPVAICKNATLALGSGGTLTVLASDVNNNSTDDVAITSITVSPNTFNCTHRNTTQNVTLTVIDADGQTSTCTATVTITDPTAVAGTTSGNQAICSGAQPANITLTGSTGTIQWQSSTDNNTFTNISGQTTSTVLGTTIGNLTSTRYYRAIVINGNCTPATSATVTVTVNTLPSAPTATNSTQYGPQIPTASVSNTNGFTTPTYTWYADNTTTTALQTSTSTTFTSSVATTTTFYVSVTNPTNGCASARTQVTVTVSAISWNGSNGGLWNVATNWTPNIVPTSVHNVIISSGNPNLNTDFTLGVGNTLTINGTGSLVVEPNKILKIAGTANFNSKSILFKSDSTGTGIFGELTGTVTGIDNVTVQRYISGRRAFRFLTPGVTTSTLIRENWQNNGLSTPGIGTHITGGTTGGFDVTQTNNPSLHTYNAQATSNNSGFTPIANTNATTLKVGVGYRLLLRGDRNVNLNNPSAIDMNVPTILSAKGILKTGSVTFNSSAGSPAPINNNSTNTQTNGYSLIGNPYVSPVDWHAVTKTGVSNNAYYTWDPTLGTNSQRGRYVVYTQTGSTTGTSNIYLGGADPLGATNRRYIQSGQAVFVKNAVLSSPATLTFDESSKATNTSYVFRSTEQSLSNGQSEFYLSLFDPNELALGGAPIDGALAVFGSNFSNILDENDVDKLNASGENLSFVRENKELAIETLAPVVANDELFVKTTQLQANKSYTFQVNTVDFDTTVGAKMVDLYLNTETSIDLSQPSFVTFTTSADASSYGSNRFKIVFNTSALGNGSFTNSGISISPNPITNNQFTLALPTSVTGNVIISIANMLGQEVYNDLKEATPTMQIMPKNQLQEGVYVVSISNNGEVIQTKIVVKN